MVNECLTTAQDDLLCSRTLSVHSTQSATKVYKSIHQQFRKVSIKLFMGEKPLHKLGPAWPSLAASPCRSSREASHKKREELTPRIALKFFSKSG